MSKSEFIQFHLQSTLNDTSSHTQASIENLDQIRSELAQITSGSFTYLLFDLLDAHNFSMETIAEHLDKLYDRNDFYGFIYFTILLSDAADFSLPIQFYEAIQDEAFFPYLCASILEDAFDRQE